jgi:hypothetical protein
MFKSRILLRWQQQDRKMIIKIIAITKQAMPVSILSPMKYNKNKKNINRQKLIKVQRDQCYVAES